MGRIYSKIIAPIQPVRRQCVRVDKEMLVEGWIDIYFFKHAFVQDGYVFIRKELVALYVSCGFSVVHGFIILSKRHKLHYKYSIITSLYYPIYCFRKSVGF